MCYEYIDSWKNLTENLPGKEELFSELNNDETPDKNQRHLQKVLNKFNIKKIQDLESIKICISQ